MLSVRLLNLSTAKPQNGITNDVDQGQTAQCAIRSLIHKVWEIEFQTNGISDFFFWKFSHYNFALLN